MVATPVPTLTVVLFVGSVHTRLVSVQPAGMFNSDAVQLPGGTLNVWLLGSVASASSSSEKSWLMVLLLFRLKLKSCASSGMAFLTMMIVPFGIKVTTLACIWLSR